MRNTKQLWTEKGVPSLAKAFASAGGMKVLLDTIRENGGTDADKAIDSRPEFESLEARSQKVREDFEKL